MAIEIKCIRCGATCVSEVVAEVLRWDETHDALCPALASEESREEHE